jgi:hypothetical protein
VTTTGSSEPSSFARLLHTPILSSSDVIDFRLSDGTSLRVQDEQLRQIYQALWDLSDVPGAISTAAMLMHEGNQSARFRHPIELNAAQGDVLRQALGSIR